MNLFKALGLAVAFSFSSQILANEPQLFYFNQNLKIAAEEKVEDLKEFEINNEEAIKVASFQTKRKVARSIAMKVKLPSNG